MRVSTYESKEEKIAVWLNKQFFYLPLNMKVKEYDSFIEFSIYGCDSGRITIYVDEINISEVRRELNSIISKFLNKPYIKYKFRVWFTYFRLVLFNLGTMINYKR